MYKYILLGLGLLIFIFTDNIENTFPSLLDQLKLYYPNFFEELPLK